MIHKINTFPFVDKIIETIQFEYTSSKITVVVCDCTTDKKFCITCDQYIGFTEIGNWDESIINSIKLEKGGDLVKKSLSVIRKNYSNTDISFMHKKISDSFHQLTINLIDGTEIRIAAKHFSLEE